ncbi:MAG: dihydrodipicolinate synthase family protein [Solirubrobacterales bacterium]|nr:dihydrodipicolinate synthase family protein [Solirubrobacterales bacterium]
MKGIHAAIVTHFGGDLSLDHEAIAADVSRLVAAGIHGIVPNGTVGEGGSLSREERREAIATVVSAADGRVPVCAGISASTAEQAAIYGRDASSAGAASLMMLPPLMYRADRRELLEFFGSVARAVELPIMLYNNPLGSGSDLEPRRLAELVRELPSITAIKESSGDARRIAELVSRCPEVDVLVGGDDWALEGFCAGAAGWVSGVANVFPAECLRLWELCQSGELVPARELYQALLPLGRLDMTPKLVQYFKAALDELGLGGGPCRPPRLPLDEDELATVRRAARRGASMVEHPV